MLQKNKHLVHTQGVHGRLIFVEFFKIKLSGFAVPICDLVHDVEVLYGICYLQSATENLFKNMSDVRETAICSFTSITHISEKIYRCCLQLREVNYSLHIVRQVKHSNNKAKMILKNRKNDH